MSSGGTVRVRMFGKTDRGCVRENNEDNLLVADLVKGYTPLPMEELSRDIKENRVIIAVADGMGGAAAGEVASAIAIDALRQEFLHFRDEGSATRLKHAIERINELILAEASNNRSYKGMATTLTAALVEGGRAFIAEVGDSRAYIIRGGRIKQITTDQSWTELMIEQGLISRDAANELPNRNVIIQSLGGQPAVKVAMTAVELAAGDCLLLCTDGLSEKLTAEEMMICIHGLPNLEAACEKMIRIAKERGGEDNITVVVAAFDGSGLPASPAPEKLISYIEVISVFDHAVDTGVRDTLKFSSEQRGRAHFMNTMQTSSLTDAYPQRQQLEEQAEALREYLDNLKLALEEQIKQVDNYSEWRLARNRLDMPLQQALEALKDSTAALDRVQSALDDFNKNLSRCLGERL